MKDIVITGFGAQEAPELLAQAWRLRHRVFREGLGWDVNSVDLLEYDGFDRRAWHTAALVNGRVAGYWRALPTTEPYLLERDFPVLLGGRPAPRAPDVWEISRFALAPEATDRRALGRALVRAIGDFGVARGASRLVAVSEPAFARFIRACGLPVTEETPPVVVGRGAEGAVSAVLISLDVAGYAVAPRAAA